MNLFQPIGAFLGAWTGSVAAAIVAGLERVVSPRVVRLLEGDDGSFAVEATGKTDAIPPRIALSSSIESNSDRLMLGRNSEDHV